MVITFPFTTQVREVEREKAREKEERV